MRNFIYQWGPAIVGLAMVLLTQSGCAAAYLPCERACMSQDMIDDEHEALKVAPIDYVAIFGPVRTGNVTVER